MNAEEQYLINTVVEPVKPLRQLRSTLRENFVAIRFTQEFAGLWPDGERNWYTIRAFGIEVPLKFHPTDGQPNAALLIQRLVTERIRQILGEVRPHAIKIRLLNIEDPAYFQGAETVMTPSG